MPPRTLKGIVNEYVKTKRMDRAWLHDRDLKVYVRLTCRYIDGTVQDCLDVASAEVPEKYRGRGIFTRWMDKAEEIAAANGMTIYVESILNHRLFGFFRNKGYAFNMGSQDSMFKPPQMTGMSGLGKKR